MTKVFINRQGQLALGMKVATLIEEAPTKVDGLIVAAIDEDEIYWAVKTDDDQPFVLLPRHLVESAVEDLGEL